MFPCIQFSDVRTAPVQSPKPSPGLPHYVWHIMPRETRTPSALPALDRRHLDTIAVGEKKEQYQMYAQRKW
jgi:hypothetical protein